MFKCNVCGKEFTSAPALGGHKGSHSRSTKEYSLRRRKLLVDTVNCATCGEETTNKKYCSIQCSGKALRLENYRAKDGVLLDVNKEFIDEYYENNLFCEICGKPENRVNHYTNTPTRLSVDHCHKSNKFRGLLCSVCNRQLGWFENNQDAVIKYLSKHD